MMLLKKIIFIFLLVCLSFSFAGAELTTGQKTGDTTLRDQMLWGIDDSIIGDGSDTVGELGILDRAFKFVKDSISGLMMAISLGVFLYVGIRLAVARGNPEEFKKAVMHFVYAVVGIFIVAVAWALVTLVAGLNIG